MTDSSQGHLKATLRITAIIGLVTFCTVLVQSQAEETNAPTQLKPTVVTGSLLPTFETITAAPVDVYTIEEIERTGVNSVPALIQRLPAISGNASFGDSRGNGGDGSAAVGLRNIPLGTLVLINGRRIAPNQLPLAANVDINTIPLAAIDRIEVLKDGASAIYGADALAGVVNVILRKDFNGSEFSARYGNTFDKDASEQTYSFLTGLTTEKGSLLIGGSYYKNDALMSNDRSVSTVNRNNPLDFAFGTSGTGNPGRIGSGELGTDGSGLFYTGPIGTTPTSPADFRDFNPATDRFVFSRFTPAYVPTEKWYIFGNGNYKLLENDLLEFFAETSYARTERHNQFAPGPIVVIGGATTAPGDFTIPVTNPYNVFGTPIDTWFYRPIELGPRTEENTADAFRAVAGFRGKIPSACNIEWEIGTFYSEDDRFHRFGHDINGAALLAAINSTDPATAWNPFGNRANQPAVLKAIDLTIFDRAFSTLAGFDGLVRSDIYDLPGGMIKGALGGGMHVETANYEPDSAYQAGTMTGNSQQPWKGDRRVDDAFAEVAIPVFGKDFHCTLLHKLEVTAAGRWDHYTDFGDTENPKVGFRYQPLENESITFRGSYGTSFQAAPLADLSQNFLNFPQVSVPATSPNGTPYANAGQVDQLQFGSRVIGNPDLKPQTSDNYTIGIVLTPPQIKNFLLSVDYYRLDMKNVVFNDPQFIINKFNPGDIDPATGHEYITVDANGNLVGEEVPFLNLAAIDTDGFDIAASYGLPMDYLGKLTFNLEANYVLHWKRQASPGSEFESLLGRFSDDSALFGAMPHLKGNVGFIWEWKDFAFGTTARYVGDYRDDVTTRDVGDYWAIDMQLSYYWRKYDARFTVGVNDINDEAPPKAYAAFADFYARDLYDIRQRMYYVSVSKRF
jgi:outer membrane receptor protein involved in Fe transport